MGPLELFDLEERTTKLTRLGDPLVGLNERRNWEAFRADLNRVPAKQRNSNAGAKPVDAVLRVKLLVLQQRHNRPDDRIDYPIRERLSFMRVLGLPLEDWVPAAKTVWLGRARLKDLKGSTSCGPGSMPTRPR